MKSDEAGAAAVIAMNPATGRWVLLATILGSSMVFLDGSTVNVALPALQDALGATVVDMQWVINGYTLFLASLLLLGGSLGDRLGRRRIFLIGVVVFTAASIWCGLAPGTTSLIVGRALQGVGGALLTPGSLALINATFPKNARGQAIGLWAGFSAITSAVGPVLGGWLIDTLSWRWIFFINVPLAIAVLVVAILHVPESRDPGQHHGLDLPGATLITLGLGGVVYALLESSSRGAGDPLVLATGILGVLLLVAFMAVERRASEPMVPLELFRSRAFSGVNVLTLLIYADLSGLTFFLPMYLIQVHGYSATAAGASMLPFVILLFLLSRWSGGLLDRLGARLPLVLGSLVVAASFVAFALPGLEGTYLTTVFPGVVLLGIGMALIIAPLTTTVMAAVPDALAGTASGINNAVSRVAGLFAIGIFGVLMVAVFSVSLDAKIVQVGLSAADQEVVLAARTELAGMTPPTGLDTASRAALQQVVAESFLSGFRVVMVALALLALLAALVAAKTLAPKPAAPATPTAS